MVGGEQRPVIDTDNVCVDPAYEALVMQSVHQGMPYEVEETEIEFHLELMDETDEYQTHVRASVCLTNPIWPSRRHRAVRWGSTNAFLALVQAAAMLAVAYHNAKVNHKMIEV